MKINTIIQYFIPNNLSSDIEQIRLANIQIKFILISILIDMCYWAVSFYINFLVVQFVTVLSFFFLFGLLIGFKLKTSLRVISHLFVFYFWLVVVVVTFFSGGIQSYVLAWIALIPIMAMTLLSSKAAWGWGVIGVITVLTFYFIDIEIYVPSQLIISENNLWNASLHVGLQFFILILTYIFSRHQNDLIHKIKNQNQKLSDSYLQLKELDQYKESMTAMIVHDFKNALNTVINFSEGVPSERRLKSIHQAGQFMLNMVLNILDVQKFENTTIQLAPSNNPINKTIEEALEQLSYLIEQKSIKVTTNIDAKIVCSYDYDQTTRVIVNIVSNAIKYVPINGSIIIKTEQKDSFALTTIADNGSGIPADKAQLVFDKYTQFNTEILGGVRSTGIGLTFCKMVIEAQGGEIGVTSEEGKGSIFHFTLSMVDESLQEDLPVKTSQPKELKTQRLTLSNIEKELLTPHIYELKKWEVYDFSAVNSILSKISSDKISINKWKNEMMKALQNVNEQQYNELVNID